MSVRANWFVDQPLPLDDDQDDPWTAPIQEIGERIDLRDPKAALDLRLKELLHRESSLFNGGTMCPIKDRDDTTCHACSLSQAHSPDSALGVLCRVGREQESVLTELAVLQCRDV